MQPEFTLADYDEAAAYIRSHSSHQPTVGLVLGSGLGPLAEQISEAETIAYGDIPHFPVSTVHGHAGRLVIGQLAGVTVCAMQGRFHFYEGYSAQQITLPVRVMQRLGIKTLILTNAAGGVHPDFQVGDIMVMEDHINLTGMAGFNPLRGPNLAEFGPRFPPVNRVYTKHLRELTYAVATEQGMTLRKGVYFWLSGPNFETPAEIRMLRLIGADAVGMSTVPEAVVARQCGLRVAGLSCITNLASGRGNASLAHADVLATGARVQDTAARLIEAFARFYAEKY